MIGCEHNAEREILYPGRSIRKDDKKKTFEGGQEIYLICPHGCKEIMIGIYEKSEK